MRLGDLGTSAPCTLPVPAMYFACYGHVFCLIRPCINQLPWHFSESSPECRKLRHIVVWPARRRGSAALDDTPELGTTPKDPPTVLATSKYKMYPVTVPLREDVPFDQYATKFLSAIVSWRNILAEKKVRGRNTQQGFYRVL